MLGLIYAEEGKTVRAALVWRELVRDAPDYAPARKNLRLLGNRVEVARGETAAVALPPAAAVKATEEQRYPHSSAYEMRPRPAQSSGE
jgi:hypothetical protein